MAKALKVSEMDPLSRVLRKSMLRYVRTDEIKEGDLASLACRLVDPRKSGSDKKACEIIEGLTTSELITLLGLLDKVKPMLYEKLGLVITA